MKVGNSHSTIWTLNLENISAHQLENGSSGCPWGDETTNEGVKPMGSGSCPYQNTARAVLSSHAGQTTGESESKGFRESGLQEQVSYVQNLSPMIAESLDNVSSKGGLQTLELFSKEVLNLLCFHF